MDQVTWLLDKLPIPFVVHDKAAISYANASFTRFLPAQVDLKKIDFYAWLTEVVQNKKEVNSLINAIKKGEEISVVTDGQLNGVVHHWTIHSYLFKQPNNLLQVTWLQDSSSVYINKSYWDLHLRVSKATMQLLKEIADHKAAEERVVKLNAELVKTQQDLVDASHQAGMTEVVISVLHNIGNVLNSLGVTLETIKDSKTAVPYDKVSKVLVMLKEHESNLIDYFQNEEQGQLLLKYLTVLLEEIEQRKTAFDSEMTCLQEQFNIMKDILSAENEVTKHTAVTEKVLLSELIDSSIHILMTEDSMLTKHITINKDYQYNSFILIDKIHLMQVIVNLLKNAIDSIMESQEANARKINISVEKKNDLDQIEVRIIDNGVGILPENLPKIFTFGFSTKKKGHGFGLHNGGLIAKQLGGSLKVESEGPGLGATFILTLPISRVTDEPPKMRRIGNHG